jgi:hypothetical protein
VFAIVIGLTIHEKHELADELSKQNSSPATMPSNIGNSLSPLVITNAGNDASTNSIAPIPAPIFPDTNPN